MIKFPKTEEAMQAILTRFCHDLINPLGTAQLALEMNDKEILEKSINQSICKLEILRSVFRDMDEKKTLNNLKEYIKQNNLDVVINHYENTLSGLIFCFLEKMISKSKITINETEILLEKFYFSEEEIAMLKTQTKLNAQNIFFYLAYLKYKNNYMIEIESKENHSWKVTLKKNI